MKKFLNFVGEGVPAPFLHQIRRAHTAADFHRICAEFLDHDEPMALEPSRRRRPPTRAHSRPGKTCRPSSPRPTSETPRTADSGNGP